MSIVPTTIRIAKEDERKTNQKESKDTAYCYIVLFTFIRQPPRWSQLLVASQSIQSNSIQSNPIQSNPIQSNQKVEPTTSTENHLLSSKKQKRSKTLLQIGANDGVKGNVDFVKEILNDPESKAILVEGSPRIFQLLTKNVKTMYDETLKRIVPINAMVCEDGKQMTFYSPNLDKIRKSAGIKNIPHWVEYQIGSLEKESPSTGLSFFFQERHVSVKSVQDFILQEAINCISMASIITQSSLEADEIGLLAVDVEGFDAPLVLESFKIPGLEPDRVVFEHKSTINFFPDEFNTVMETLMARGYKFNCHRDPKAKGGWKCTGGQDVVAVKEV